MRIAYIAHPVAGDPKNLDRIIRIAEKINREEPQVVPFVPYYIDLLTLDDNDPKDRTKGIRNDTELIRRKFIDEIRLYGDRISNGMMAEIRLARELGIPIQPMTKGTTKDYHNFLVSLE